MIDLEYPNRMTTEEREAHLKMWEAAKPELNPSLKFGQMLVFGTSDNSITAEKYKDLEDVFYEPEKAEGQWATDPLRFPESTELGLQYRKDEQNKD